MHDRKKADELYRKLHRKKINKRIKKWKIDHPEETKAQAKKYRRTHRKEIRENNAEYRKRTEEERKEYNAEYYKKHPEEYKRRLNKWRKENPDKAAAQVHKRRALRTKAGGSYTKEEWEALKKKHKNKCLRCKKSKKLTPDHVVPISKGGSSNIENIQPLCQPCNSQKGSKSTDYRKISKGLCAMCGHLSHHHGTIQRLQVDHDHKCCDLHTKSCGRCLRGLLCADCNILLSYLERFLADLANPQNGEVDLRNSLAPDSWTRRAMQYLKKYASKTQEDSANGFRKHRELVI